VLDERHARYHLALAEAHDRDVMQEGRGSATLDRLQQEHDNLLQAFAWCDAPTPLAAKLGLRLAAAMRHYWTARGSMRLGLQLTLRALERAAEHKDDDSRDGFDAASFAARWWALRAAAQLSAYLGQLEQATQLGYRLVALSRRHGNAAQQAMALMQCSANARSEGLLDEAQDMLEESRRLAETVGDPKLLADALGHLATIAYDRFDREGAVALSRQVLAVRRTSGHGYHLAVALLNTSVSLMDSGQLEEVAPLLREAAALLPAVGSFSLDAYLIEFTASYAALRGDWATVAQLMAASGRLRAEQDMPLAPCDTGERQALVGGALAALGEAAMQIETTAGLGLARTAALSRAMQALNGP
jgi:tetratricopeptide (TPR) repeat protein